MLNSSKATRWFALASFLAFLKFVVFVFDSNPQVFLGDSMSYLATAMAGWIPPDRSFLYGFVIHELTTRSRSLSSLVAVQSVAGILTALGTAAIVCRLIRAQFAIAAVAAVAIALEPQQLLYERFVMTETFSTAVFTLLLLLALEYIRSRKAWLLIPMQLTGIVLVAFRLTYLPMLMVATVLGPIWAMMVSGGRDFVALSRHVVISVLLFFGLHTAYKQWNGWLSNLPAAYSYADGFFLISNVSPLITAADTDTPELIPVLAQPRVYGSDVAQFNSRNAEMFAPDGLVAQMERVLGADYRANVEAKRIAYHAIRRDPIGLVRLAFQTYLKFYSREYMSEILRFEAGMSELEPEQLKTLALYHLDAKGLPSMKTLTRGYYLRAWPFYILLGLTPLILLVCSLLYRGETALILSFLLVITTVHVAAVQVLGVEPSPRHLHSVSVVLAIAVGALAGYPRQNQSSRKN